MVQKPRTRHYQNNVNVRVSVTNFRVPLTAPRTSDRLDQNVSALRTFFVSLNSPQWARASSFTRFLDHTQRRISVGRTPLDEWSARRRDVYLTRQHSQQTDIYVSGGIRTHNLSSRAAENLRLRPRGHWNRPLRTFAAWNQRPQRQINKWRNEQEFYDIYTPYYNLHVHGSVHHHS
jgi:hypothetical protein